MSSLPALLSAMPPKSGGPTLMGPEGDVYYAIFVGVVLVALVIGSVIFYRRGSGGPGSPAGGGTGAPR